MTARISQSLVVLALAGLALDPPVRSQTCSAFTTCDQAMRSFQSGNTGLDGDSDGIPCENLCSSGMPAAMTPRTDGAECGLNSAQIYAVGRGEHVAVRGGSCYMEFHNPN